MDEKGFWALRGPWPILDMSVEFWRVGVNRKWA